MTKFPEYKTVSVDKLIPYARNSRTHSAEQVAQIAASIKEFGFLNPIIIDGDNGIIAGHGRVMAAKQLNLKELPCIEVSHLSDAQRKAYVIADNKLALNAGWDDEMLRIELEELGEAGFNLDITGFNLDEISKLFDSTGGISLDSEDNDEPIDEIIIKFPPEKRTKVMNLVSRAIEDIPSASIWCDDE